jgi:hypothetical protein
MSAAITAGTGATPSALSHDGTQVVKFDATGVSTGAGKRLAQSVTTVVSTVSTGTTVIPLDNTVPQNTEGDQYLSVTITPTNAASTLEITVQWHGANSAAGNYMTGALFQDATVGAIAVCMNNSFQAGAPLPLPLYHTMVAGSVAATTFKYRVGGTSAGTTTFNGAASAQLLGGVMASRITVKEYLP